MTTYEVSVITADVFNGGTTFVARVVSTYIIVTHRVRFANRTTIGTYANGSWEYCSVVV